MKKETITSGCLIALMVASIYPFSALAEKRKHLFLNNHPRIRRIVKAVGLGAVTGGLAAPLIGRSAASGATLGALRHGATRGYKEKRDMKRSSRPK